MNLKEIKNSQSLNILSVFAAIAIKGGDDKRPPRPGGGPGQPPFPPNGVEITDYSEYELQ
jgi:hypothetical protein